MRIVTYDPGPFCCPVGVAADAVEIRIVVSGEQDPVRDERAARELRDDLLAVDGVVDARFASLAPARFPGAKGAGASETIALVATVAPAATTIVVAFIRAWADRASHRKVVVSSDGSFEVHGGVGRREEGLVRDLHGAERGTEEARPAGDDVDG